MDVLRGPRDEMKPERLSEELLAVYNSLESRDRKGGLDPG